MARFRLSIPTVKIQQKDSISKLYQILMLVINLGYTDIVNGFKVSILMSDILKVVMSEKSFEITLPDHKSSENDTNLLRPDGTKEKVSEKDESFEKTISKKKPNELLDKSPKVDAAESSTIDNLAKNVAKLEDKPLKETKIEQPVSSISSTNEPSIKSSELADKLGNDRASESENENHVNKVGHQHEKRVNFFGVPSIMDSKNTRRSSTYLIDRSVLLSNQQSTSATFIKRQLIIFSVSVCFVAYVLLRLIRS